MPQVKPELGSFIRSVRENRGLTQAQMALYTGITQSEISRIESGARQQPAPEYLRKISEVLNIAPRQLMVIAGYLEEDSPETLTPWERLEHALIALNEFTMDEVEDVLEYVRFRISRKHETASKKEQMQAQAKEFEELERKRQLANLKKSEE